MIIILAVSLSDQLPYMLKAEGDLHNPDVLEKRHFSMKKTDQMILRDDSYYRVFPITENPFNSNDYSYYHNSIGGYNAAKLRIYQDIIENCFYSGSDKVLPLNWNVMKMLNTKYIISSQQLPPNNMKLYYHDKSANLFTYQTTIGSKPAWFVNEYKVIEDRLQRFDEINAESFDAFETAILEEDPKIKISKPVEGNIQIIEESFNEISYKVTNDQPTLFVASEIFYPAGWKCYIDGNETEIFKTNHILRSVFIKDTGTHEIRFEFSPDTYNKNLTFSIIGHIIAWVALIVLAVLNFMNFRKRKQEVGI